MQETPGKGPEATWGGFGGAPRESSSIQPSVHVLYQTHTSPQELLDPSSRPPSLPPAQHCASILNAGHELFGPLKGTLILTTIRFPCWSPAQSARQWIGLDFCGQEWLGQYLYCSCFLALRYSGRRTADQFASRAKPALFVPSKIFNIEQA